MENNCDLRKAAKAAGVPLWRIGDALGFSEPTMTRKFRRELPVNEKNKILSVIAALTEEDQRDA